MCVMERMLSRRLSKAFTEIRLAGLTNVMEMEDTSDCVEDPSSTGSELGSARARTVTGSIVDSVPHCNGGDSSHSFPQVLIQGNCERNQRVIMLTLTLAGKLHLSSRVETIVKSPMSSFHSLVQENGSLLNNVL